MACMLHVYECPDHLKGPGDEATITFDHFAFSARAASCACACANERERHIRFLRGVAAHINERDCPLNKWPLAGEADDKSANAYLICVTLRIQYSSYWTRCSRWQMRLNFLCYQFLWFSCAMEIHWLWPRLQSSSVVFTITPLWINLWMCTWTYQKRNMTYCKLRDAVFFCV